jgi:hypothetical protein
MSKSGISYSIGITGARINTGPKGTYVTFNSHGISYRKRISPPTGERFTNETTNVEKIQVLEHTITSAPIDQLTDSESKDFINELTEKCRKISYLRWLGIPITILFPFLTYQYFQQLSRTVTDKDYFISVNSNSVKLHTQPSAQSKTIKLMDTQSKLDFIDSAGQGWYKGKYQDSTGYVARQYSSLDSTITNTHVFTILDDHSTKFGILLIMELTGCFAFCIYLYQKDKKRLTIEIYYEMDDKIRQVHDKFIQHFSEIMASGRVWQYLNAQSTTDFKRNAGAGQLITRVKVKSITPNKKPERFFSTNIQIPNIQLRNTDLYFFPERLIIKRGNEFGAVFYKNIHLDSLSTRFIEEESITPDAEIVDWTWKFLNKNGSPDKRFNNNRQLPICLYSQYHFSSATGLNEILTTSRKGAFDNFSKFLTAIGQLQNRLNLD